MNRNIKNYRNTEPNFTSIFLLILQFHFTGTSYDLVLSDASMPGINEWL